MIIGFEFPIGGGRKDDLFSEGWKRIIPFSEVKAVNYEVLASGAVNLEVYYNLEEDPFEVMGPDAELFLYQYKTFLGMHKHDGVIPPPPKHDRYK
jgi:hypothetical protein